MQKVTEVKVPYKIFKHSTILYPMLLVHQSCLDLYVQTMLCWFCSYLCKTLHEACRGVRGLLPHEILRATFSIVAGFYSFWIWRGCMGWGSGGCSSLNDLKADDLKVKLCLQLYFCQFFFFLGEGGGVVFKMCSTLIICTCRTSAQAFRGYFSLQYTVYEITKLV